jgi:hypothetical protein
VSPRSARVAAAVFVLSLLPAGEARADDGVADPPIAQTAGPPASAPKRSVWRRRSPLAVGAAVLPGAVVHGSGHFAAGDPKTGLTLLAAQGAGVGMLGVGLGTLVASGASRKLVGPAAALMVFGGGLWFLTWLADIYGVSSPDAGTGAPRRELPLLETATGYRYVHDPVFRPRGYVVESFDLRLGRLRLRPEAWFAASDSISRIELRAAGRIYGPLVASSRRPRAQDGSFLDMEVAASRHGFPAESFEIGAVESQLSGRLDLSRVASTMRGSFAEASAGVALTRVGYDVAGAGPDFSELLLARFAWGVYIGRPTGGVWGEALVYYDHRHDGVLGGARLAGLGSGVPGSAGVSGTMYFTRDWGLKLDAAAGSAWMGGLSVLVRAGGSR